MKASKVGFVVTNDDQVLQQKGNWKTVGHGCESHGGQKDFWTKKDHDHQWLGDCSNQGRFQGQPFGIPDASDSGDNGCQSHQGNDGKDDFKLIFGHKFLEIGFHKHTNPLELDTDNQEA